MSTHIIVLSTVSNDVEAEKIARKLVDDQLAACVNIVGPVKSIYRWKGEVHHDEERLLIIKTVRDRFERVRIAIGEMHTYELPEAVAIPIEAGDEMYLNWITDHSSGVVS